MRIREGHVSNSSSSSYVLITTKENYERAMKEATSLSKTVVKAMKPKRQKCLGIPAVVFHTYDCHGEGTFGHLADELGDKIPLSDTRGDEEADESQKWDRAEAAENAWDDFVSLLEKNKDGVWTDSSSL